MAAEKSSFELHLEKLKDEYQAQLPSKIAALASDWQLLLTQWNKEVIIKLHRNVHSLIGTSGTFGFSVISANAKTLEEQLKPLLKEESMEYKINIETIKSVIAMIDELATLSSHTNEKSNNTQASSLLIETPNDYNTLHKYLLHSRHTDTASQNVLIYYVGAETAHPESLRQNLISYGFKSQYFETIEDLLYASQRQQPSLIVFDIATTTSNVEHIFNVAHTFVEKGVKVFIFSGQDDFNNRLLSVRAGIHSYTTKPADISSLVGMIRHHFNLNNNKPTHILIVDDQISIAKFYAVILEQTGMKVTIETNPHEVLHILQSSMPDLLLLDLNMPDVNGDELAAVVRQHEQFQTIPILFLSGSAQSDKKTDLLEIGSDDLLSKEMAPEEFVRHIKSRVDRAKILTAMMYQDSLTGLLNHAQIQLAADRVFMQCKRKSTIFTVAMIDIDKFKSVNDTYGHLTGDRVIKALAQLLQQRLRLTDYIGRFGGEEFLLIMPDINTHDASNLINGLREAFHLIDFKENNISFNVSFSAGIAENTGMESFIKQIKMADEALYKAKKGGRNIVCTNLPYNEH